MSQQDARIADLSAHLVELEAVNAKLRARATELYRQFTAAKRLHTPKDIRTLSDSVAEFVTDEGKRYAWSESNCRFEEVAPGGGSFQLMRIRLERAEARIAEMEGATP